MTRISVLLAVGLCAMTITAHAQTMSETTKLPSDTSVASVAGNEKYRIGFQDVLNVRVYRHPDLDQTVSVSPTGTIRLLRIDNPIVAVCRTEKELEDEIRSAYQEKTLRNPIITVQVSQQQSQSIAIFGAVEKPATFFITRRVHLLELLAMAGGPKKEAGTRMTVARTGSTSTCADPHSSNDSDVSILAFKVKDVREGKVTFWMKPGDVVSVSDADSIYVYGNVNRQGAFKVGEPITLTQSLVLAEGLKGAAKKDKIRVLRQKDGSEEREELIFDLNQIDKRKVNDPFLQPNDIVAVSDDKVKAIVLGLANAIKGSVPNVIYRLPLP